MKFFLAGVIPLISFVSAQTTSAPASINSQTVTQSADPGATTITEPVYDSSLSKFVTTTRTSTTTPVAISKPTDLSSSLSCSAENRANGPFCIPANGTEQIKNKEYSVTWDSEYFPNCSDVTLALLYVGNEGGQLATSTQQTNVLGFWNYTVKSGWLQGHSSQYAQFIAIPYNCVGETPGSVDGPIINIRKKTTVTKGQEPLTKDKIVGLAVGLPLAAIIFVLFVLLLTYYNKNHRVIPKFDLKKRRKGYTGRKNRGVKLRDMPPTRDEFADETEGFDMQTPITEEFRDTPHGKATYSDNP